jgi:mycofactocin precursor
MSEPITGPAAEDPPAESAAGLEQPVEEVLVEEDLLVEDVSIDGMCGVY